MKSPLSCLATCSSLCCRIAGLVIALLVAGLDQWSKVALVSLAAEIPLPLEITPFFNLVLTHNTGVSFGMFAHMKAWMPLILTLATSAIALGLVVWLIRSLNKATSGALGLIIGGALGNILDRARLGAVIDFLDFHIGALHWPAFNVADSAIFIGVVILLLISIVGSHET